MKILFIMLISMLIIFLFFLFYFTQKSFNMYKDKWSHFECGFNSMVPSHIPFSFQFFLIAILFLIFDVEIALILSFPMEMLNMKNIAFIFSFLLFLTIGLIYEWQKGKVDWSK